MEAVVSEPRAGDEPLPLEPDAETEPAGVETFALTATEVFWSTLAPTCADETGVETLVLALVPFGPELACTDAAGVEALALTDAVGGLGGVLAVAETDAEAAGVETATVAVAGAEVDGALAVTLAETGIAGGVPVRPSALAGAAKDRHQRATAATADTETRKPNFRFMIVISLRRTMNSCWAAHSPAPENRNTLLARAARI